MSDEQVTETTETTEEEKVDVKPENKIDELPEWARKEIKKGNDEAAKYRVQLRELSEKYKDAKTPAEIEAVTKELADTNKRLERDLLVERVGRDLPDELRALLQGNTEEELRAHAEKLAKFAPAKEIDVDTLDGGLKPGEKPDDFDVKKAATLIRQGRL